MKCVPEVYLKTAFHQTEFGSMEFDSALWRHWHGRRCRGKRAGCSLLRRECVGLSCRALVLLLLLLRGGRSHLEPKFRCVIIHVFELLDFHPRTGCDPDRENFSASLELSN
jgi:hypothetical protein